MQNRRSTTSQMRPEGRVGHRDPSRVRVVAGVSLGKGRGDRNKGCLRCEGKDHFPLLSNISLVIAETVDQLFHQVRY